MGRAEACPVSRRDPVTHSPEMLSELWAAWAAAFFSTFLDKPERCEKFRKALVSAGPDIIGNMAEAHAITRRLAL